MPEPVSVTLTDGELALCRKYAANAEIGGRSNIRGSDRQEALRVDQLVGQVANLAYCKVHCGNAMGHFYYRTVRALADRAPHKGDDGSDLLHSNIDVKGSLIRSSLPLREHRLSVRPRERHPGHVYVLALVEEGCQCVHLMGWATDDDLPPEPESSGVFEGAFVIRACDLERQMPVVWSA